MYPTKKLFEICKIIGGGTPSKNNPQYYNGDILWASVRDMKNESLENTELKISEEAVKESSTHIIPAGSVIIATRVGLGKVCLNKFPTAINQDLKGILPKDTKNIGVSYLFWWFKSISRKLEDAGTGATVKGVKINFIESLEIPLPPLFTQSVIVTKLDSAFANIDEQISLLRANIADVENMKFGVIEKIFEEGNFEIKTLKDVCERIMDGTHFSPKNSDIGDRLYVSAKNIKLHGVDLTKATYISEEDHEIIYKRCPVKKGDVLYIKDGATTGIATINQLDEEFSLLSSVAVFQVKKNILSEQFLNYYLNSNFGKKHMISMMGGAAITRLTLTKLNSGLIPLPSLPRQQEIVAHLDRVFAETTLLGSEYEAQIRDLEIMKQSLLEEAFSGRLVTEK